jgi:hypothetical protein
MIKRESIAALAALAVLGLGCGSNEPTEQTTPTCVGPPIPACILQVDDGSFVRTAGAVTDGVSTAKVRYTPRKYCMSGNLDPGPTNSNWGAFLGLPLTSAMATAPFTASSLGIAQVQVTIDPPPPAGVKVGLAAFQRADCLTKPDCLTAADFFLTDDDGAEKVIDSAGTVTAALTSFVQPNWGDPNLSFDPDLIASLHFVPGILPGVVLPYDFCVRDVKFLDADGREVLP